MIHFTRIQPIVGDELFQRQVAVLGVAEAAPVVALLACSGLLRWQLLDEGPAADGLIAALLRHHGADLPWHFERQLAPCDLLIVAGDDGRLAEAHRLARAVGCPLLALLSGPVYPALQPDIANGFVVQRLSQSPNVEGYLLPPQPARPFAAAALGRALLLRGSPHARPDLEALLEQVEPRTKNGEPKPTLSHRFSVLGSQSSLLAPRSSLLAPFTTPRPSELLRDCHVLVVGCGSLGSYAACHLAPLIGRLTLVDPGVVTAANPARQLYPIGRVGECKAQALTVELRELLGDTAPIIEAVVGGATDDAEEWIAHLVSAKRPDVALLLTGTATDLAYGRGLRAMGVPHLATRCYPRARFWEAVVVPDGDAPCLGCLRGQLYIGSHAPPTPEEAVRYSTAHDLVGEPATLVESGWAAACAADLAVQLLVPPGLRERWFLDALGAEQTCFLGGAYVVGLGDWGLGTGDWGPGEGGAMPAGERFAYGIERPGQGIRDRGLGTGDWGPGEGGAMLAGAPFAYGIERPGQVRAYGLAEVMGSAATRICGDCGRRWPTRFRAIERRSEGRG